MGYSCTIDNDTGEQGQIFTKHNRKALKEHKCYECGKIILPGEKYCYESGKWADEIHSYRTCLDCLSIRDEIFCSYVYGNIWEDLREQIGGYGIPESCIANLTQRAREMVCEEIEGQWEEDEE